VLEELMDQIPFRFRAEYRGTHIVMPAIGVIVDYRTTRIDRDTLKIQIREMNNEGFAPLFIFGGKLYFKTTMKGEGEGRHYRLRARSVERHLLDAVYKDVEHIYSFYEDMDIARTSNLKVLIYYNGISFRWFSPFRRYRTKYFNGITDKVDFTQLDIEKRETTIGEIAIFVDREDTEQQTRLYR